MSLKILITNDDGIDAIGLSYLVEHAKKYGEVMVVAPKIEQSAKSQKMSWSMTKPYSYYINIILLYIHLFF